MTASSAEKFEPRLGCHTKLSKRQVNIIYDKFHSQIPAVQLFNEKVNKDWLIYLSEVKYTNNFAL